MVRFLERGGWVVYLDEYRRDPDIYDGFRIPEWFDRLRDPWVIVPLSYAENLVAFIVLRRSTTKASLNWEDTDLLKTVGRQAAGHLALWLTTRALLDVRQFEAFNRLSAYVVHDLKNIVAQLNLVVSNAQRHKRSPEFIDDAIQTIENASGKMNRMLSQLRKGTEETVSARPIAVADMLAAAVAARSQDLPHPQLETGPRNLHVRADPDRLGSVIEHLVQNAQEATPPSGEVRVRWLSDPDGVVIEIEDNGSGMDEAFVLDRLFRPFDTTKGNAGMGIGVYQSRELVRSIGGELSVVSSPQAGTTFRVRLPVCEPAVGRGPDVNRAVELAS